MSVVAFKASVDLGILIVPSQKSEKDKVNAMAMVQGDRTK
jgi:hypothetical protein